MADSSPHALDIADLVVSYDGRHNVLDHVSFDVRAGETFGLIGLNGAGKTTLIKTILGLRDPQGGKISLFGKDRSDAEARRNLAYLPERFDPPWFLGGMDFIRFAARLYNRRANEDTVVEGARAMGLDPAVLPRRVRTYSKGMRQKLGLLATINTGSSLLILDEPMSGLDPRARVQVKEILTLEKKYGKTIFLSSHILSDMDEICDRVAVLHGGTIRYIGPPGGLRDRTGEATLEKAFLRILEDRPVAV